MLERNSNKFMYVIGAIVIAAALIAGAKLVFPSLFTNVQNTMIVEADSDEQLSQTGSYSLSNLPKVGGSTTHIYGSISLDDGAIKVTKTSDTSETFYRFKSEGDHSMGTLVAGKTYILTGQIKSDMDSVIPRWGYHLSNGAETSYFNDGDFSKYPNLLTSKGSWNTFSYTFTIPTGVSGVNISLEDANTNDTTGTYFEFKNVQLNQLAN